MPAVPVSASTEAALKKLYEEKKAAGEEDDAINAALAAATPAVIVFNQIDIDGSGSIDTGELKRLLKGLPRNKPTDGSPFMPVHESNGRGTANHDLHAIDAMHPTHWLISAQVRALRGDGFYFRR